MANNSTLVRRGYGATTRISFTEILVPGLLSFWVYTVYKFNHVVQNHLHERSKEFGAVYKNSSDSPNKTIINPAFQSSQKMPFLAMVLYGLSGIIVISIFFIWSVMAITQSYTVMMSEMLLASTLFYLATIIIMLWALRTLQFHEQSELLLYESNAEISSLNDFVPSDELTLRWEAMHNKVILFLILSLPMVYSPSYGTHLFLTGQSAAYHLLPAISCFVFAIIFHLWGTALLAELFNSHLAFEQNQSTQDKSENIHNDDNNLTSAPMKQPADSVANNPKRTLTAIMLTDIVGYSKAMERDEPGTYQRLLIHNEIIRSAIENHQGREVKTIGDAFLIVFSSVMSAVDCAISIQETLTDYNENRIESEKILIRIGVHLGDVLITDDDIYGDGVNVTARIEPLADPGGICVSEEVYTLVRKRIELQVEQLENPSLKNISVAPRIYKVHFR